MALELIAQFENPEWYRHHRTAIIAAVCKLPTFVKKIGEDEFWLKDESYGNQWDFDVRIFPKDKSFLIEASAFSKAFTMDVRFLFESLAKQTQVVLTDDDEPFSFQE